LGKLKHVPIFGTISRPSGRQVRKWHVQAKCSEDKEQMLFCQTASQELGLKANPSKFATIAEKGIDPFEKTTCPFCLGLNPLRLFLISAKKGYDRGIGKCPLCDKKMKLSTIVKMETWTPEQYAAFVYDYRSSGFWQKISFATWKKRLNMMNWGKRFWDEYKRLKGGFLDDETERRYKELANEYEASFK